MVKDGRDFNSLKKRKRMRIEEGGREGGREGEKETHGKRGARDRGEGGEFVGKCFRKMRISEENVIKIKSQRKKKSMRVRV